jgi:predicted glycosyltransferase
MQLTIETTANETVIRLPNGVHFEYLQQLLDYLSAKETLSRSQATESEVDDLSEQAQADWWKANKNRWIQ